MTDPARPPRQSMRGPGVILFAALVVLVAGVTLFVVLGGRRTTSGLGPGPTPSGSASSAVASPGPTVNSSQGASPSLSPPANPTGSGSLPVRPSAAVPTTLPGVVTPAPPEVLVGAGDIARCNSDQDEATARLLDAIEGMVFAAGDTVYDSGTPREYRDCYGPTWGRHRDRTLFPAPGDHEYETAGAAGYLEYFGAAAAPNGTTWYSREAGSWHVVVLDSNCDFVGGCGDGSAQLAWLRADLAASGARCTLAIIHHPRFSSGFHGSYDFVDPFWRVLYEAGAELVVSGDDHSYERFAPQDPDAGGDPERGIRQFVVGTGGTALRDMGSIEPNSEVRDDDTHGVLRLELSGDGYAWQFIPVAGQTFTDAGSQACH